MGGAREPLRPREETTRFFRVDGIQKASPGVELASADPVTVGCRIRKSDAERALMRRANEITLEAWRATQEFLLSR